MIRKLLITSFMILSAMLTALIADITGDSPSQQGPLQISENPEERPDVKYLIIARAREQESFPKIVEKIRSLEPRLLLGDGKQRETLLVALGASTTDSAALHDYLQGANLGNEKWALVAPADQSAGELQQLLSLAKLYPHDEYTVQVFNIGAASMPREENLSKRSDPSEAQTLQAL